MSDVAEMSLYAQYAGYYEEIFPPRESVYRFLHSLAPRSAGRVLDVGCGTGHYCARFASAGFSAVGIDADKEMINAATERHSRSGRNPPRFERLRMEELRALTAEPFDLVFCIGNVMAHLPPEDLRAFLANLRTHLRPKGLWAFQVVNWDTILARGGHTFPAKPIASAPGTTFARSYEELSAERVRFVTRLVGPRGVRFEASTWLYPVRAREYLRLHTLSGFELLGHYGDFTRTPFDAQTSGASVLVFQKV